MSSDHLYSIAPSTGWGLHWLEEVAEMRLRLLFLPHSVGQHRLASVSIGVDHGQGKDKAQACDTLRQSWKFGWFKKVFQHRCHLNTATFKALIFESAGHMKTWPRYWRSTGILCGRYFGHDWCGSWRLEISERIYDSIHLKFLINQQLYSIEFLMMKVYKSE